MAAVHFDQSKTGELPRHFEAAGLAGDLGQDEFLSGYSDAELEEVARARHEAAEGAMLACCADVVEFCRRAGAAPTHRAQALRSYQQLTGRAQWQVYQMFLVGRFYTPERKEQFPTVTYEHLSSAIRYTHRDGDTPDLRDARIERVVIEAADADLTVSKTRALAQSLDREPPSRGELLDPWPEPEAKTVAEAYAPMLDAAFPEDLVARFTAGLEKRLTRENPGLWTDCAIIVRMFLCERVAQGWRLEAPR